MIMTHVQTDGNHKYKLILKSTLRGKNILEYLLRDLRLSFFCVYNMQFLKINNI